MRDAARLVLGLLAVLAVLHPARAADDNDLIDQLVTGSPWKGENIGERGLGSVTYDMTFGKDPRGGLTGVMANYSIAAFADVANGPIAMPSVKNGVLRFQTRRGTYELTPTSDGRWAGFASSGDQSFGAKVTLRPK